MYVKRWYARDGKGNPAGIMAQKEATTEEIRAFCKHVLSAEETLKTMNRKGEQECK